MPSDKRRETGQRGEERAVRYLSGRLGYIIICRNFRTREGEIDIIALDQETLVFVEVRTAQDSGIGQSSITSKKRQKMCKVALKYIENSKRDFKNLRFDAVFIEKEPAEGLEHVENIIMLA